MRTLLKLFMIISVLFTMTGAAFAASDPNSANSEFKSMKETYNIGERVKFTVETLTEGELQSAELKSVAIGVSNDDFENVRTVKGKMDSYTTTGYLTPRSKGVYIVGFTAKIKGLNSEVFESKANTVIKVVNPNEISMTVSPSVAVVKLGQEIPILVSYTSKYTPKFNLDRDKHKFTLVGTKKVDGVYKRVYLYKPTDVTNYTIDVTAETKYDTKTETIKFTVVD